MDDKTRKRIRAGINLKPTKNDQTREHAFCKTFVVDQNDGSLSGGESLLQMLEDDEKWTKEQDKVLLRNDRGVEVTFDESQTIDPKRC